MADIQGQGESIQKTRGINSMTRRPRICVVATTPLTVYFFLRPHIEELAKFADVTLAVNPKNDDYTPPLDLPVFLAPVGLKRPVEPISDIRALFDLFVLFRRQQFDLVWAVAPKAGFLGMLAARLAGVKNRVFVFQGEVWASRQGLWRSVLKFVDKLTAVHATHLIAVSPSERQFLEMEGVVNPGSVSVLGAGSIAGVNLLRYCPAPEVRRRVRLELNIPEEAVLILFVGRINADKGVYELAEAFREVAEKRSNAWLVIVGPDEENATPKLRAILGDATERCQFIGFTSEPMRYMAAADFICLPSHREGFGMVVIEAASVGIPAIGFDVYGISDAIVNNVTGILSMRGSIPMLADAMCTLIDFPEVRIQYGKAARERVLRDFEQSKVVGLYVDLMRGILEKNNLISFPARRSGIQSGKQGSTEAITAIVVNYNSGALLTVCVTSLLASSFQVKVVVSDNGSSDDSLARLSAFCGDDERLVIVRNGANMGFSVGCNIGLSYAVGDYVLFINPDCVIPAAAIEQMCTLMDARPDAGMASCLVRSLDGTEQVGCRRNVPTPWRSMVRVLRLNHLFPDNQLFQTFNMKGTPLPAHPTEVEAISGAFMFVRRIALERVGAFDEHYFLHCEDLDLCMRFKQAGYTILFQPNVEITHLKGGSRASPLFVEWHKHKGMVRFYRLHFRSRYPFALMLLVIAAVCTRFLLMAPYLLFRRKHVDILDARIISNRYAGLWRNNESPNAQRTVIVSGATSEIGRFLLPHLVEAGYRVIALSRKIAPAWKNETSSDVFWLKADISEAASLAVMPSAFCLIHLAPLVILPEQIAAFAAIGVNRVIAISSSSKSSKAESSVAAERAFARRLAAAEHALDEHCREYGIPWTIFRPTLMYGHGMDRNITFIRRWIKVLRVCPLFGEGKGLRRPVHAEDLATACVTVLNNPHTFDKSYELSGGEALTYRAMVERIFASQHLKPRFVQISLPLFAAAMRMIALIPRYGDFNVAMAQRMNEDLDYPHDAATHDFGYRPRKFFP